MSILNHAIVFNDEDLFSLENLLRSQLSYGLGENIQSAILKACSEYRFLKKYLPAKGLTKQVIFFFLDPVSNTAQGIQSFFENLQIWVVIVSDEEQALYQEILEYYEPREDWDDIEVAAIRDSLMSVILELQPIQDTKAPMQNHPEYKIYESFMMNYGSDLAPSNVESLVPDLKGKAISSQFYNQYLEQPI